MATNVDSAIQYVLREEDSTLSGNVTTTKGDRGGATRFGIAERSHPELISSGFFDITRVTRDQALFTAELVYTRSYAYPLRIAFIVDQAVATALLSMGINAGTVKAAELLQRACTTLGTEVADDGAIGSATLVAINSCKPDLLLAGFVANVELFYKNLAAADPDDEKFLKGWDNRAEGWLKNAVAMRSVLVGKS